MRAGEGDGPAGARARGGDGWPVTKRSTGGRGGFNKTARQETPGAAVGGSASGSEAGHGSVAGLGAGLVVCTGGPSDTQRHSQRQTRQVRGSTTQQHSPDTNWPPRTPNRRSFPSLTWLIHVIPYQIPIVRHAPARYPPDSRRRFHWEMGSPSSRPRGHRAQRPARRFCDPLVRPGLVRNCVAARHCAMALRSPSSTVRHCARQSQNAGPDAHPVPPLLATQSSAGLRLSRHVFSSRRVRSSCLQQYVQGK